jgi:hypothetical protein
MIGFLKHLLITIMNRYGSFMWFGTHVGVTIVDLHYVLEIFLCIFVNFLVIFSVYLEWRDKKIENLKEHNEKFKDENS